APVVSAAEQVAVQQPALAIPLPAPVPERRWRSRLVLAVIAVMLVVGAVFVFKSLNDVPDIPNPSAENAAANVGDREAKLVAEEKTGSLEMFVLPSNGVQLTVDNSPVQPVPRTIDLTAGAHRLLFTADGYLPQTVSQTVEAGQHTVLPILMERAT